MNIGDNYARDLIINALYRASQTQTQSDSQSSDAGKLFSAVLNQLLAQLEGDQATGGTDISSYIPDMFSQIDSTSNTETVANTISSSNSSLRFSEITPEQLENALEGKLKGMGEAFVRAGKTFNIDPALLAAIAKHETGNGKSRAAKEKNNIAGMMGVNGLKAYASVEDSINDMARNLSKNYLGKGLSSIVKIGAKYAPIHADNDPTGLNNYWVKGVSNYFNQLRG